jgi:hypothetical protein
LTAAKGSVPFVDNEQHLERRKETASNRIGAPGLALRRIEQETGVRRETASAYLKAAGIGVRPPRAWGRRPPAKPANEVITGSKPESAGVNRNINPENPPYKGKSNSQDSKPANEMITGFGVGLSGVSAKNHSPTASACEPFREAIELGLSRGRNAMGIWQDLVADHGFHAGYDVRYTNRNWLTLFLPSRRQVEKAECCSAHQLASP